MSQANVILTERIRAAGIPLDGLMRLRPDDEEQSHWHVYQRSDGVRVRLDFAPEATGTQIADAEAMVEAFDADAETNKPASRAERAWNNMPHDARRVLASVVIYIGHRQTGDPLPNWARETLGDTYTFLKSL